MIRIVVPIAAGLVYGLFAGSLWNLYSALSPVEGWLIEAVASEGYDRLYVLADLVHVCLAHVVFAAPLIAVLAYTGLLRAWLAIGAASVVAFVAASLGADGSSSLLQGAGFWLDAATVAVGPLLAFAATRAFATASEPFESASP